MEQVSGFLQKWSLLADQPGLAVVDKTGRYSFKDVNQRACQITSQITSLIGSLITGLRSEQSRDRGFLGGARVGILVEPGVEFVASFVGVLAAGGTAVVLSPLHPNAESAYFCQDAGVALVLVSSIWKSRVQEFAPGILVLEVGVDSAQTEAAGANDSSGLFLFNAEPKSGPKFEPKFESKAGFISNSAPALQLYTSGTTGKPKGAVLTHGNLAAQQELLRDAWGLCESDVLLHALPLHHMHGLCIGLWSVLGAGGGVSFVYPFEAAQVWNEMRNATVFMAVPTIYAKLLTYLEIASHSSEVRESWKVGAKNLRLATSGSAALPVTLAEKWKALTDQYPLERFGMTEVGVALSNPLEGRRKPGRVGLPLTSVEYKVVNEAGEESEVGELWIAGPSVFSEYYQRGESTASAFTMQGGVRFFRTGDRVTRDEDGYFKILGRNSVDILKSGGYKLSAIEIEEVFREHPAVAEVAVVGVPDEVWGDRVIACVVLRQTLEVPCTEDVLRDFAKAQMASYKVPKQIVFLERLPTNALGKVLKQELVRACAEIT